jgi:hypothetical protein
MRRIVITLLIALFALQSVWTAAANACQHDCSAMGKNFGHHHHAQDDGAHGAHSAHDAPADAPDESGTAAGGNDSTTHSHGSLAVVADPPPAMTVSASGYLPSPYARFVADRFPDSLLRPPLPSMA